MREIKRVSVTDSIVNEIREMIESGQVAPGKKLPTESEMCQNMKVSRTSVREAIRVLQAIGLVEILPGKGAFVASTPIDKKENWYDESGLAIQDFIEVRMAVEVISTKLAIEKAVKKQVDKLKKIHLSFSEAMKERNLTGLIMYDEMFHTEIVSITGNKLLINLNRQVVTANRKYRGESFMDDSIYQNALVHHEKIMDCFLNNDPERGMICMQAHLEEVKRDVTYLEEKYRKSGQRQETVIN